MNKRIIIHNTPIKDTQELARICTLEPLRKLGRKSLICAYSELEAVRLTEVYISWGGAYGDLQLLQSADCFLSPRFKAKITTLPEKAYIVSATFMVKPRNSTIWRRVIVHPPDSITYDTAADQILIEPWLINRKFITHP